MMLRTIFCFCVGLYSFSITAAYCTSQEVDPYIELKVLKKQSNVVNQQYLNSLKKLEIIADQDDFIAQKHYISAVRYLKWNPDTLVSDSMPSNPNLQQIKKWENLESIRMPILNNMARYRDNLIQKYEEGIRNCENEFEISKIKFSLAKIKFLGIKKDL